MHILNIPNSLTITRIILIPLFVTAIVYDKDRYALYLFGIAALTDTFDGLIARLKKQKTALGTFLDPLADKFLLVTSFVLFTIYGPIPKWLTITIISRDVIVITGWVLLYLVTHTARVEPTVVGKAAIASQMIFVWYILLRKNFASLPRAEGYLIWITAVFTIVSGLHYIYRGLKQSNA